MTADEAALAAEIAATNGDVTAINSSIDSIELLLGDVNGNLVDSVDSLEVALAAEIAATNADFVSADTRFDGLYAALAAEIAATNADFVSVNAALAAEIAATNADFVSADTRFDGLDSALAAEIAATNADVASLATVDAGLNTRIVALEGFIQEDTQESVEKFVGGGLSYTVAQPVQDDLVALVDVYVNGHHVEVESVAGNLINLVDPGYAIDADDVVLINYQF